MPDDSPWTLVFCFEKENGLSYRHQSRYRCTPWQRLAELRRRGKKVKGRGHVAMKKVTSLAKRAAAAGVGLHVDATAWVSIVSAKRAAGTS